LPLDKKNIKFSNNMLGQTIALGLNLRLLGDLGSFNLTAGDLVTASAHFNGFVDGQPTFATDENSCETAGTISQKVIDAMVQFSGGSTVLDLWKLANHVLARGDTTVGSGASAVDITIGDVHAVVGLINEAFDECRSVCPEPAAD
jgi:hypothetical protein